jgi:hypothetical protein
MAVLRRSQARSKIAEARVRRRFAAGLCLSKVYIDVDGASVVADCPNLAGGRRGLCGSCYHKFRTETMKGTPEDQLEYEDRVIREGLVLADREKLTLSSNNLLQRRA